MLQKFNILATVWVSYHYFDDLKLLWNYFYIWIYTEKGLLNFNKYLFKWYY